MQCPMSKGGKQPRNLIQVAILQVQPFPDCSRVLFHQCWVLALLQAWEPSWQGSPPPPRFQEPTAALGKKDTSFAWELPPTELWYPSNASDTKSPRPRPELLVSSAQPRDIAATAQGRAGDGGWGRAAWGERVGVSTRCEPCFAISFLQRSSKRDNYYVDWRFFLIR